jgi:hypothetical protein
LRLQGGVLAVTTTISSRKTLSFIEQPLGLKGCKVGLVIIHIQHFGIGRNGMVDPYVIY